VKSTVRALKLDQSPWVGLYALTLAGQWFAAVARWILVYIALELVRLITGWPIPSNPIALAFAFAPLVVSLLAVLCPPLIEPLDGRWWEITSGGRPPEDDEREAFDRALSELQDIDPNLRAPRHWFVAEAPGSNAAAYAASMQVERGLLESPYAAAVIAHELGHLRTSDARVSSALNLLALTRTGKPVLWPVWSLPFRWFWWLACGQAVMALTGHAWEMYWRTREYAADEYAARLGQGPALASSLEIDSLPYEQPIPRMRFSRATHPYTKPRIARLRTPLQQGGLAPVVALPDALEALRPATDRADTEATDRAARAPVKPASDYDRLLQRLGANFG
jgi:Zn-dependent protease with chaperone function